IILEEDILKRFLSGDCDLDEEQKVLRWLESPDAKMQLDKLLQKKWEKPSPVFKDQTDYIALLDRIHRRVNKQKKMPKQRWSKMWIQGAKIAASISLLIFSAYFLVEGFKYEGSEPQSVNGPLLKTITRVTGPGEKLTLNLPDHTKIIVNALSEISFTSDYGKEERVVNLKGEAFFEIAPDSLRPFRVLTDGLTTTALGTSFNVFARYRQYKIALTEGRVKLDASDRKVELAPGQLALWDEERPDTDFLVQRFNPERVTGWKEGILLFERKTLKLILDDLAAWYGVEMEIEKTVDLNQKVVGTFQNKNLKDILTGLGFSTGFDFDIKGKRVQIINSSL
ncbi:MAG: FecR domain-containing protein, partial [Cyclobacteriaceae bacterium]